MPPSSGYFERTTETVSPPTPEPLGRVVRDACLVQIYPSGPSMGKRHALVDGPSLIGRGGDCGVRIDDHSVSRRHSRVEPSPRGHAVVDLQSTNGTFVNNVAVAHGELEDGDYLRVGNYIYRYLAGGNIEAAYHEEIYRLTILDGLTEVHNKRYLLEFLGRELARAARHRRSLALILFDIDHFKAINDRHGHLCGDRVLRELAGRLKPAVRAEELLARYGGEEFAVVLPECSPEDARGVAERLRILVEAELFSYEGETLKVTISLGLATVGGTEFLPVDSLVQQADAKLYEAKRGGRNRVAG